MLRVGRLHKGRNHFWRQQNHHTYQGRLPLKDPNYGQVASSSHLPVHNTRQQLCPTFALSSYPEKSFHLPRGNTLFVHPKSGLPLLSGRLSFWIAKAISTFDSSNRGTAHDCRKFGHSLAFTRTRGVLPKTILSQGFWTTINMFIHKYLIPVDETIVTCITGRSGV